MWKKKKREKEQAEDMKGIVRQLKRSKKGLSRDELSEIVTEACEQLSELKRQIVLAEQEYEAVTAYLTDMQKIDRMDEKKSHELKDAARQMLNLNKDRNRYQNNEHRIDPEKYWIFERNEKRFPEEMKQLAEQEDYRSLVQSDLRQLEGERGVILYEREQAEDKKHFLQKLSVAGASVVILTFLTLLVIGLVTDTAMIVPLLLTMVLAVAIAAYVVVTASQCDKVIRESEYRMNRVIQLVNKVKIKLVNCTGILDYAYEKYQVESLQELQWLWERYIETRDQERRYRKSTELLTHYQELLVKGLREAGIEDPEIWLYQAEALLNEKEMVEVRHQLNTRRQKIRERLEMNRKQEDACVEELLALRESQTAYRDVVERILAEYHVEKE